MQRTQHPTVQHNRVSRGCRRSFCCAPCPTLSGSCAARTVCFSAANVIDLVVLSLYKAALTCCVVRPVCITLARRQRVYYAAHLSLAAAACSEGSGFTAAA